MRFYYRLTAVIVLMCAVILTYDLLTVKTSSQTSSQMLAKVFPGIASPTPSPSPSLLPIATVIDIVNKDRLSLGFSSLNQGQKTCAVLDEYLVRQELADQTIASLCPDCQRINIFSLPKHTSIELLRAYLNQNEPVNTLIKDETFTHYCLKENHDYYFVAAAVAAAAIKNSSTSLPVSTKVITENELWTALMEYRKANTVPELTKDENLCVYARKRVNDHVEMVKTGRTKDSYPVPDKYPLDAHEGFRRDADSGYVFEITKKQTVAENLAYWPNAAYATHVIEWGWDTSTEGHRETQLSRDYASGCLAGAEGFFVAIYAR